MSSDLAERFVAHSTKILRRDEQVLGVLKVNAVGTRSATVWLAASPLGGVPVDEALPVGYLLVLTDQRVMAVRCSLTGRPRALAATWEGEGARLEIEDRGERAKVRRLGVRLGGGRVVVADAPINGAALDDAELFVSTFELYAAAVGPN